VKTLVRILKAEGLQKQAGWMRSVFAVMLWFFVRGLLGIPGVLHQTFDQFVVSVAILGVCLAVSWIVVSVVLHRIQKGRGHQRPLRRS
jgi:hypothetical protein